MVCEKGRKHGTEVTKKKLTERVVSDASNPAFGKRRVHLSEKKRSKVENAARKWSQDMVRRRKTKELEALLPGITAVALFGPSERLSSSSVELSDNH